MNTTRQVLTVIVDSATDVPELVMQEIISKAIAMGLTARITDNMYFLYEDKPIRLVGWMKTIGK
jgi:hypothetical protein